MREDSKQLDAEKEPSENQSYHDDAKLLTISSWSNTVSWIALAGYVLAFFGRLIAAFQNFSQEGTVTTGSPPFLTFIAQYNFWVNSLILLATGTTFFLVLQGVSQGILMLMDLEENRFPSNRE